MNDAAIHIGTSGWHYKHWSGTYYPANLAAGDYLDYYCKRFQTVEINNSFYQLPEAETLESWRETVSGDFTFAVKANRYITHMKNLKDAQEAVENFLERVVILGDRLGPILFQLPPKWDLNLERLRTFLQGLPQDFRYTFEFRDPRWFDDDVLALLREHQAAFCIYHLKGHLSPREVTADFVYIRLHGPLEEAYQGKYGKNQLAGWAGAISTWARQGKDVYCYFDNDMEGFAPENAAELKEMLDE